MPTSSPSASCSWAGRRISIRRDHSCRSHAEYVAGRTLEEMIEENLVAERIAIDSYRDAIQYLGANLTMCCMLETILAAEEKHADELANLLKSRIARG